MRIADSRVWFATAAAICCGTAAFLLSGSLNAQSVATPSFTEAQATQGKAVYERNCLSCHGANLDDGEFGPPLKGVEFRLRWGAKPIDGLLGEMMRMPPAAPGSLGEGNYVPLLAFLARENGVLPGTRALSGEPAALRAMALPGAIGGPSGGLTTGVPIPPPPPRPNPLDRLTPVTDLMLSAPADGEWLTWRRSFDAQGFSPLTQVTRDNVSDLRLTWSWALPNGPNEVTPLVHDGVMFVHAYGDKVQALDAATGDLLWQYSHRLGPGRAPSVKRAISIYGTRLYVPTSDAHIVALDAKTGRVRWDVAAGEADKGYSFTGAPLAVKDKIIIGVAGGEFGIRGFIDAYDAETGKRAWRFHTIPGEGERGNDTWAGDSWKRGGAPTWVTGSYDPDLNLVYWGTGNPGPQMYGANRAGDNLYSDSLVALDPDTGTLKWHFQFTPHDVHDWDSTHTPVLFDDTIAGQPRKLVAVANRNGFFYVLDRVTGAYLVGRPYTQVTWAKELDANGRPIVLPGTDPTPDGNRVCPSGTGGTNWHQPSYNPKTRLVYFFSKEQCDTFMADAKLEPQHRPGRPYIGSAFFAPPGEHDEAAVRAVDPKTGTIRWEFREFSGAWAGVFSTAGGLVFSGDGQGNFIALDAESGKDLWHMPLGADVHSAAISYGIGVRQFITIPAGGAIFTFALPEGM